MTAQVTIIGSGHMARALAQTALKADRAVQILGRNGSQTRDLVESLGPGASGGVVGAAVEGGIVVLAVPYGEARKAIQELGDAIDGRVIVDITNTVDVSTFDRLLTPAGTSSAEQIAEAVGGRADVVKAFNTVFAGPLGAGSVDGQHLDIFIAGDSEAAKEKVSALVARAQMRPIDVGPLRRARELEAIMLPIFALQVSPAHENFNWDISLRILP
ncbi:NADP oxidoreductase [Sinomonas cyclohexanicum]|uniref:NADP oxidoreductase n=1 Tax=Sinomonas cyclohexanicum TaxID=322009 RepID=A0ABN6FK11_SINCY|nr:NAD(P)-binding domain-containing protein [Corynebacterium cyclohexanicum]BCT76396.1 NADP oxidoreductase [Corynebacterium cyclohexanicum]